MKLASLVRIEFLKTTRRRAFWVAAAFLLFITLMISGSGLVAGRAGGGPPFVAPFSWAMAASEFGPMPAFFLALTLVMLLTSEYTWRTARQNVIDGLSKEQFFVAKCLTMLMVAGAFMAIPFLATTGVTLYGRMTRATPLSTAAVDTSAERRESALRDSTMRARRDSSARALATARTASDSALVMEARRADSLQAALRQQLRDARRQGPRAVYPAPDPRAPLVSLDDLQVAGGFALGSLGFASMAFMLSILLRSTGGAIGVFFMYFAFLEQVIALAVRRLGGVEFANQVMPYFPMSAFRGPQNPNVWHDAYVERANAIAASMGQAGVTVSTDLARLIGLPLGWIVVFVAVAFVVFRRRDL